jgi:hypothetical protein
MERLSLGRWVYRRGKLGGWHYGEGGLRVVSRSEKYVKSALQGLYGAVQAKSIEELQDSGSARAYMPATEDHDGGSDVQTIAIR